MIGFIEIYFFNPLVRARTSNVLEKFVMLSNAKTKASKTGELYYIDDKTARIATIKHQSIAIYANRNVKIQTQIYI